jgi:hypothetical protein
LDLGRRGLFGFDKKTTDFRPWNSVVVFVRRRRCLREFCYDLGFALTVSEERFEGDESESGRGAQSLHAVVHLKFLIDVRQVKVYGSLRHDHFVGSFLAAVALCD